MTTKSEIKLSAQEWIINRLGKDCTDNDKRVAALLVEAAYAQGFEDMKDAARKVLQKQASALQGVYQHNLTSNE